MALLAVAQMCSTEDCESNFTTCAKLVARAKSRGAALVALPENFAYLAEEDGSAAKVMVPLDDDWPRRYFALAREHGIWICFGGFPERGPDETHAFNAHIVVDDRGAVRDVYRKLHLFDIDLTGGPSLRESKAIAAGDQMVVTGSPVGQLGLSVCYDLRFPELYVSLTQRGAQVLLIPAAFTATTGKAHWEVLLRARAIETQTFVAAAAQWGRHNARRHSHGHAMIIDPWGAILAQCGEGEGLAVAEVDLDYLRDVRRRLPVFDHRRRDVYGRVGGGEG
ncbi:MAG: carbon-nitrogen hydrolase family protein [Chloroflexi bacterium]|nr:carbon-nitrogen hydrolase family protein [Chloroflexota bacterium]